MIGTSELIVIALVIFFFFGGEQLPKVARSLGGFIAELNKAKEEGLGAFEELKGSPKKKNNSKKN